MPISNRIHRHRSLFVVVLLTCLASSLSAHEFWIEPTTFVPATGKIIGVRARVGDGVLGDPVPRDPALLEEMLVATGSGRVPVAGRDGGDPAGLLRITTDGLHVIGYLGKPMPIELSADKFNTYLRDEGLNDVMAARSRHGISDRSARELFTRCAKTLVLAGTARADQRDRALGFPLELVVESNPYLAAPGRELSFRLLYRGQPLKGALVTAIRRQNGERLSARSDRAGRVRFALPADGAWLIKSVHMIESPAKNEADWVSYWASLTFEIPETTAPDHTGTH